MAYLNTTTQNAVRTPNLTGAFKSMATRYRQHRLYRETLNSLQDLSNRELADLGLHRHDLRRVAMEASRR